MKNHDQIPLIFGKELKRLRQQFGLSQEKLSELAGVDKSYICLLEQGKRQPTLVILYKLAEALQISLSKLIDILDKEIPDIDNISQ